MDADELKKKLEDMGIHVGKWGESEAGKKAVPPTLLRQRKSLETLKGILEAQLQKDREKRAALHETLSRVKHGGGQ
jgi:hypothetical protein